jgi:hypothetical protein
MINWNQGTQSARRSCPNSIPNLQRAVSQNGDCAPRMPVFWGKQVWQSLKKWSFEKN